MKPEPRSIRPKSYKEALGLPQALDKTESPYAGTLNSTPMRVARGGRTAEAVAVGASVVKVISPLVGPAAKAGDGAQAQASPKPASPTPSVVLVDSDPSPTDGWQVAKRPRRPARRVRVGDHDGAREPSPPPRSQKKRPSKARLSPSPSRLEESRGGVNPAESQEAGSAKPREAGAAPTQPGSGVSSPKVLAPPSMAF